MSNFLKYLRNDKGGAVEYVLMVAGIGGLLVAVFQLAGVTKAFNAMFTDIFTEAGARVKL
jgi:Flp pilus assembly pilin Flp